LVSASNETNTDLITLTATDVSAIKAQELLQKVVKETRQDFTVSITDSLTKMSDEYYKESEKLTVEIEELILRYNDIVRENSLPGILLLQTMLTDDISLALTNEQLAPLNKIDGTLQNELLQLKAQIDIKSEQYRKVLANYHSFKLGKDSFQVEQYIRTIVEPNLPSGASSPNKKLNLLIGLVIGLMVGMGIVLFREYWKATAK
ncbi:MAG: GNVR domain-containing protein, partial [Lysinibacillus sp.]